MLVILVIIVMSTLNVIVSFIPSLPALNPVLLSSKSFLTSQNSLVAEDLIPKPYQSGCEIADGFGMNQHRQMDASMPLVYEELSSIKLMKMVTRLLSRARNQELLDNVLPMLFIL